jgi:2-polyprenyl-3-methyl-5-hydroxy-6-metoxy-1,4-benzoquinol methylase
MKNNGQKTDSLITPEILELCKISAVKHGVIPDIHPDDFIFHFLLNHPSLQQKKDAVDYYFDDGARSAKKLADILYTDLKFQKGIHMKILEFASGYGCLTRHLSRELPDVTIVSCDIHEEAIDFIKSKLKTDTILSESVPEKLRLNAEYDVVFALSFFSHMPESTWGRWIKTLFSGLKENGFLIFTTHGMASAKLFGDPVIPSNGFWFLPDSEQKDLNLNDYGTTVVTPEYVITELYRQVRSPLVLYRYAFWWTHQDLYIVQKLPCPVKNQEK